MMPLNTKIRYTNGFIGGIKMAKTPDKKLIGKKFNRLTVKSFIGKINNRVGMWKCLCQCGKETIANKTELKNGHTKSCGCLKYDYNSIAGNSYNGFNVLEKVGYNDKRQSAIYLCECKNCGKKIERLARLITGKKYKSCGCLNKSLNREPGEGSFNDVYENYKRNAKTRKIIFEIDKEKFKEITQLSCFYCGIEPKNISKISKNGHYIYNGLDRINNSIGYLNDNVRPSCFNCNRAKMDLSVDEFNKWIKRLIDNYGKLL